MSEVRTFFRYCPACGKRFHIKLVSKKLLDEKRETTTIKAMFKEKGSLVTPGVWRTGGLGRPVLLEEDVPMTIDVENFEHTYKCRHCGHVWTE